LRLRRHIALVSPYCAGKRRMLATPSLTENAFATKTSHANLRILDVARNEPRFEEPVMSRWFELNPQR